MRDNRPCPSSSLLNVCASDLCTRAARLSQLDQKIKMLLSPALAKNCRVANYRDNTLIIQASSASWATRFQYEQQTLTDQLRQSYLPHLKQIKITVNPELALAQIESFRSLHKKKQLQISEQTADNLLKLAAHTDEKVSKRLQQIASLINPAKKTFKAFGDD
ncbi:MAG: DUF721 domain-containing protein [Vibrionaceae bacterium]